MKTFTDSTGRSWTVTITVDAIKRAKALTGVDLLDAVGGELLERLVADPVLLCDLVYALCKPQADQLGVSDEDFGRSMAGDAIEQATEAMLQELVGFFPSRRRTVLAKAVGKLRDLEEAMLAAAGQRVDALDVQEAIARAMASMDAPAKTSGAPSTRLPASSDAIPATSP